MQRLMMTAEVSVGIQPEFLVAQLLMVIVLIGIFAVAKKFFGYLGILFWICLIGIVYAGYHGVERLSNFGSDDDVAGAILLSGDVLAMVGLACYWHNRQAGKKE